MRAKPEKFADHCTQAKLFFKSQTSVEQAQIAATFRFERYKPGVKVMGEAVKHHVKKGQTSCSRKPRKAD